MEREVHTRYSAWSTTLWAKLRELGFEEQGSDKGYQGEKTTKHFWKGDSTLHISIQPSVITLSRLEDIKDADGREKTEWVVKYKGGSVNKELLENFAAKGFYNK